MIPIRREARGSEQMDDEKSNLRCMALLMRSVDGCWCCCGRNIVAPGSFMTYRSP